MMEIDGSVLEGGGQILRIAVALSALLKKPVKITKIRYGRPRPGLSEQHKAGIELVRDICGATVTGLNIGSTEITFTPGRIRSGNFSASLRGAGSMSLLLQVALPLILFGDGKSCLSLKGGTNAAFAPFIDFMTDIFRPSLEEFGASFDFMLEQRGYYPRGGGHCYFDAHPVKQLDGVDLTNFGEIERIFGSSFVAGSIPTEKSMEIRQGAIDELTNSLEFTNIKIEAYKESRDAAKDNAAGIFLGCKTNKRCVVGASALCNIPNNEYETGKECAQEVVRCVKLKSCVDEHVQDQLIIYMALAHGKSRVKCTLPITMHTRTAMHIAKLMTNVTYNVIENGLTGMIECTGIGYKNEFLN